MKDLIPELRQIVDLVSPGVTKRMAIISHACATPAQLKAIHDQNKINDIGVRMVSGSSSDSDDEPHRKDQDVFLGQFMHIMTSIREAIVLVTERIVQMHQLKNELVKNTKQEQEKAINESVMKVCSEVTACLQVVKTTLAAIEEENTQYCAMRPNEAEGRIRVNLHKSITRKYRAVTQDFTAAHAEFQSASRAKMKRQVMHLHEVDEAGADAYIREHEQAGGGANVITNLVQNQFTRGGATANALADIEDKLSDMKMLNQEIQKLKEMFEETNALVEANGEMLDSIEHNVEQAGDFTDKAVVNMKDSNRISKKNKKCASWVSGIVGVALGVTLLIVFL